MYLSEIVCYILNNFASTLETEKQSDGEKIRLKGGKD
jgi:hypothetical protein